MQMQIEPENLAKIYLGAAVLFFLFLVYTAVSAEYASRDIMSGMVAESPPEAHSLRFFSVTPHSSPVTGVINGKEIAANRLDLPNCATSRRLVLKAEGGAGLTIFSRGAASKLVHPSMFEELRDSETETDKALDENRVLYQVPLPEMGKAVFPWAQSGTPSNPPDAPRPPFLAFV